MLPSLLHELLTAAAFLTRDPARRTSTGWVPRAVGYAHTFLFLVFLQIASIWHPEWVTASDNQNAKLAGSYLWLTSSIIGLWPLWYLRRSFSLEPEARTLVITGPYRLARHPIYAVYIVNNFGIWLRTLSLPFLAVYCLWLVLLAHSSSVRGAGTVGRVSRVRRLPPASGGVRPQAQAWRGVDRR